MRGVVVWSFCIAMFASLIATFVRVGTVTGGDGLVAFGLGFLSLIFGGAALAVVAFPEESA